MKTDSFTDMKKVIFVVAMLFVTVGVYGQNYKLEPTPETSAMEMIDSIVARYPGQIVVLDFWATWCPACLETISGMKSIKQALARRGAQLIYITDQTSPEDKWRSQANKMGEIHYYLPRNFLWAMLKMRGVRSITTVIVFDEQRRVIYQDYPYNSDIIKEIDKIKKL